MKSAWTRDRPAIELDGPAIAELVAPLFPGASITSFARVTGGLSNTNIKVTTSGRAKPVLLRLYQRDPASARKEVAVTARIAGSVPVAPFLYFSEHNSITGQAYAITEWIDGELLDQIAAGLDRQAITILGRSIGHVLAAIHDFTFDRPGFFADDLHVPEAIDLGRSGLLAYLRQCVVEGPGAARLGADLTAALLSFAEREGELLDSWLDPPSLVHGDFNGPNILLHRSSLGEWEIAAILDWEFALSGSPALDFGNFLRPPLGHHTELVAAIADGYRKAGGSLPAEWQRVARVADLFAWADILSRPDIGAAVIADARAVVREVITPDDAC